MPTGTWSIRSATRWRITSSDPNAALPANAALSGGTQTFSVKFNTAGSRTVTATDITDGSKTANTSPAITVNLGAFAKLQVLLPGETAAPGHPDRQDRQPDRPDRGHRLHRDGQCGGRCLQPHQHQRHGASHLQRRQCDFAGQCGPGQRDHQTLSVTNKTVGSWTVTASDVTHARHRRRTPVRRSRSMPGPLPSCNCWCRARRRRRAAPSGKTGTPSAETAGTGYSVTVNAVDANWNVVSTNDTVGITSTRPQRDLAGQRGPGGGNPDPQPDQQYGGQLDGDGFGHHPRGHHGQHQPVDHRSLRAPLPSCNC